MANIMQHNNLEDLKRKAELAPDTMRTIRQIKKSTVMYEKVRSLFRNAVAKKNEPEQAYILYSRCINICNLMLKCDDFTSFSRSTDAKQFHEIFDQSLSEFERLESYLKSMYGSIESAKFNTQLNSALAIKEPELHPVDREDFGRFLKPIQLVEYVEKFRKTVLILDYRPQKLPGILYKDHNLIKVLPVDPTNIQQGLIFNHLRLYVELRYRTALFEIQTFDLVVLMGEELEDRDSAPFKDGTKTRLLLDAITYYNFSHPLKRPPLLLEGGFRAWDDAYPMYVEWPREHQEGAFEDLNGFDDEFTMLVAQVKRSLVFDIKYPEIGSPTSNSSSKSIIRNIPITMSTNHTNNSNNFNNVNNYPTNNSNNFVEHPSPAMPSYKHYVKNNHEPQQLPHSIASAKLIPHPKTQIVDSPEINDLPIAYESDEHKTVFPVNLPSANLPSVDRSKKPSIPIDKPTDKPTDKPADRHMDKVLLGGARMDVSTAGPAPMVVMNRPQQPPIPDRTKRPIDPEKQQQLNSIFHIYERSMYLIENNVAPAQVPPGYTGLVNLGNTCFMNSALQALFNTPGMRDLFTQKKFLNCINPKNKSKSKGMISACFSALMDSIWSGRFMYIKPDNFLNVFAKEVDSELADRRQHDSQEFFSCLVESLHAETNRVESKQPFGQNYDGKDIRNHAAHYLKNSDLFELTSVATLTCMVCGTSSVIFENMYIILLELPPDQGSPCSLSSCLKHYFGEDYLDGEQKWKGCIKCKHPQRAMRSLKTWAFPPVLVICLKRFAMRNGESVKNKINVDFNVKGLDMTPYIHKGAVSHLGPFYDLYAVTNHEGTLNSGHYISTVHNKQTDRWLKFDDERVSDITNSAPIQSQSAYILYYRNRSL